MSCWSARTTDVVKFTWTAAKSRSEYCFGNLPLWTTYYWRVDGHCEDGTYAKGKVWSFTTGCELIPGDTNLDCLVNFEDFACVAETWMQEQLWPFCMPITNRG